MREIALHIRETYKFMRSIMALYPSLQPRIYQARHIWLYFDTGSHPEKLNHLHFVPKIDYVNRISNMYLKR